ncbi:hypothetical protein OIU84_025550 [Salix udensis]|uniref:Uncharacterized protein n=1 Tax=Salix udensis TaxID=889485 RepID=A0AAD6PBX0_9ROSI|nr:hypothetical protein OIU84_025550 [Salix udensis]
MRVSAGGEEERSFVVVEEYWGVMGFAGKDGEERMEEVGDSVNWIEAITDQQLIMRVSAGGEEAVSSNNNNSLWTSAGGGRVGRKWSYDLGVHGAISWGCLCHFGARNERLKTI